ncbi:MAG: hypothetical protein ACRDZZ_01960 [Ilumatobacteraceae bacterium]
MEAALLVGLAGVFIANATVAWLEPDDFNRLFERSAAGRWFDVDPGGWLGPLIGLNDLLVGTALLVSIGVRRARPIVLAWAGIWLFAVTLVKLTALPALGA